MPKKLTQEQIIEKFKNIHKDRYLYSKVNYINFHKKVKIICKLHGMFTQAPNNHINGQNCPQCTGKFKYTLEEFVKKANLTHKNVYDYSLVKEYNSCKEKVTILCIAHGTFTQTPEMHINQKTGCPKCAAINRGKSKTKKLDSFISQAKIIHGNEYDYSKTVYLRHNLKVEIVCKIHGTFFQQPQVHINGGGCQRCKKSRGHKRIAELLKLENVLFEEEKTFTDCINPKTNYKLRFDFYLPKFNTCIEFDGAQHFVSNGFFGGTNELKNTQFKDKVKDLYCKEKGIVLLRIPFYEEKNINKFLEIILKQ